MKNKSKELIKKYGIVWQLKSRPTKNAKGMSFTNERRARRTNNSFFYASFVNRSKYQQSKESRTLSVRGTLDRLASTNRMKRAKLKKWKIAYNKRKIAS